MQTTCRYLTFVVLGTAMFALAQVEPQATRTPHALRTIELETTRVTAADVALSPDRKTLAFSLLGQIFLLPSSGGQARQLTFGNHYNSEPIFSPDGTLLAFVSDRDGSEGNLFLFDLQSSSLRQLTKEPWAQRPAWRPEGDRIAYISRDPQKRYPAQGTPHEVNIRSGEVRELSSGPRQVQSVFYLPDGTSGWAVVERDPATSSVSTRIEVRNGEGAPKLIRTMNGAVEAAEISPSGKVLVCRRGFSSPSGAHVEEEEVVAIPLEGNAEKLVTLVAPHRPLRFAISGDDQRIFMNEAGLLWRIDLASLAREVIPFHARVRMQVPVLLPPPSTDEDRNEEVAILTPVLSPDRKTLAFVAGGYLWRQSLGGGTAERVNSTGFASWPSFSPDGRFLAFVHSQQGRDEIRVHNLQANTTRTVTEGTWQPNWSPDGTRIAFAKYDGIFRVLVATVASGNTVEIATTGQWSPRPHFAHDDAVVYYTTQQKVMRHEISKGPADALTALIFPASDAVVSRDATRVVFRRNREIWFAPLIGGHPVPESAARLLTDEGGDSFSFAPDGSAIVYAVGNRVFTKPLDGGQLQELSIHLSPVRRRPPPLIVRNVRVLDWQTGRFTPPTSIFIDSGRIRRIGPVRDQLTEKANELDARNRFAIPGLIDTHVHIDRFHGVAAPQEAFIAYGVTSVRELGGEARWLKALNDRSGWADDRLPRYFFAGQYLEGNTPYNGDMAQMLSTPEQVRQAVGGIKADGGSLVKVYGSLPWPLQRHAAERARQLRLPVLGEAWSAADVVRSVLAGYSGVVHAGFGPFHDDILRLLSASGTAWEPTLGIGGGNLLLLEREPDRWHAPKFQKLGKRLYLDTGIRCPYGTGARGVWHGHLAAVRTAFEAGVRLQAGTDSAHACEHYGSALHWELEHLANSGIAPVDVLRIATKGNALAIGMDSKLGDLSPGKLADIVLLDANPLNDIRNTQKIWRVLKGGWVFDPTELVSSSGAPSAQSRD